MKRIPQWIRILFAVAFWMFVWWAAARSVDSPLLFPTPQTVLRVLWELVRTKEFYLVTGRSLRNVMAGILSALLLGVLLAFAGRRLRLLRDLLLPLMTVIKATPVASFIVLLLIFIGAAKVPALITFLIVLPVVWTNLDEGLERMDPGLAEVARVYEFSPCGGSGCWCSPPCVPTSFPPAARRWDWHGKRALRRRFWQPRAGRSDA